MKEKWNIWLPVIFVAVFAVSRIPGLLPQNFSAVYAFAFCAGVYFFKTIFVVAAIAGSGRDGSGS
ncbi:MAG: hypothetical protein WDM76_01835 [Limisphaerales bacterium]